MSAGAACVSVRHHGSLLLLLLLARPPAFAQEQPTADSQQVRRLTLAPKPPAELPRIAIRPGFATLLLFDGRIARDGVELEARERFSRVAVGEDTLTLLPSEALQAGEHLRLTVRFATGAIPVEAGFLLVVTRERADTQVEVVRTGPERMEPAGMAEELLRLREENARLRAERGPEGLAGAIAAGWLGADGITALDPMKPVPRSTGAALRKAVSFRAQDRVGLSVELTLSSGERPWSAGSAALTGADGRRLHIIQLWQSGSTTEDSWVRIVVEAEAGRQEAQAVYTLELREAEGDRSVTVSPLRFPAL